MLFRRRKRIITPGEALSQIQMSGRVRAVLRNVHTGRKRVHETSNLVVNTGNYYLVHHAVKSVGGTEDSQFAAWTMNHFELGNGGDAPNVTSHRGNMTGKVANSLKQIDTGYPWQADTDSDNPGGASLETITYRVSYTTAEANDPAIDRAIITNASPGASENVLAYAVFSPAFAKTSADVLKVFWNLFFQGV